jgi:hypothetical protein
MNNPNNLTRFVNNSTVVPKYTLDFSICDRFEINHKKENFEEWKNPKNENNSKSQKNSNSSSNKGRDILL